MRCVSTFAWRYLGSPALRAVDADAGTSFCGVGFGKQLFNGHLHERRIRGRGSTIGEGDLQYLGEQMQRIRRTETEGADIVAFEDIQHLDDVQRPGGGRRWAHDLIAAIGAADWFAIDSAIGSQIVARDVTTRLRHMLGVVNAERARVEQIRSLARDAAQRLGVVAGDEPRARLDWYA